MKNAFSILILFFPVLLAVSFNACRKPDVNTETVTMSVNGTNNSQVPAIFPEVFKPDITQREHRVIDYTFPNSVGSQKIEVEFVDGHTIFEGDIVLGNGSVTDRDAGISGQGYRWSKGIIPYVIESGHPYRNTILAAIDRINQNTILRVQVRNGETDYVRFIYDGGCWATNIGKGGGRDTISIGPGCNVEGIVMHEIFHAAGMYHEQSRSDRNAYVQINTQNIIEGKENNFARVNNAISHFSYDFGSIMHYPAYAFSKNGLPTIEPLVPLPNGVEMGQRVDLSDSDIGGIKKLYLMSSLTLTPSKFIRSANGEFELKYQEDGNLVLRRRSDNKMLWSTRTDGKPAGTCVMKGEGNLVLYKPNGDAIWQSGTGGNDFAFSRLALQNDGNLVIYNRYDQPVWSTGTSGGKVADDTLLPGESLKPGEDIWSNNRQYQLIYQPDGNLVIYRNRYHVPLWSSQTNGKAAGKCIMQADGNLVIYTPANQPVWNTGTFGAGFSNSKLVMQDDGNLVIYKSNGQPSWASGTAE